MRKCLVIGVVLLCVSTSLCALARSDDKEGTRSIGNTLYVGGTGPGNYSKIQDAINAATFGDTVFVYSRGSPYKENVIINQSILLEGEDKETAVIDAGQRGNGTVLLASCTVTGFTIRNASDYWTASLILILSDGNTVADNILDGTVNGNITMTTGITVCGNENFIARNIITGTWRSIGLNNASNNYISDNVFGETINDIHLEGSTATQICNNRFTKARSGNLYISRGSNDCLVVNNSFNATLYVFKIDDSENVCVFGNTFEGGAAGAVISADHINLSQNTFRNGRHGIEINHGDYNIIYGNRFWNNEYAIIYTGESSYGKVMHNTISDCENGIAISTEGTDNLFTRNDLRHIDLGIYAWIHRGTATITENNFIENNRSMLFVLTYPFRVQAPGNPCLDRNYYQELRHGWKLIFGVNILCYIQFPRHYPLPIILPWLICDKHPAEAPFEINTP